jgi:hypothetical protein
MAALLRNNTDDENIILSNGKIFNPASVNEQDGINNDNLVYRYVVIAVKNTFWMILISPSFKQNDILYI